jgi:hypothetical protein
MTDRAPRISVLRLAPAGLLGACLLAVACLELVERTRRLLEEPKVAADFKQRFAPLLPHLPERGVLGFVTAPEVLAALTSGKGFEGLTPTELNAVLTMNLFLCAQALAPRHLVLGEQQEWVVGSFLWEERVPALPPGSPHELVAQGPHGVRLWKRR